MTRGTPTVATWPWRWWAASLRACGWPGLCGLALLAGAAIDIVRTHAAVGLLPALPVVSAMPSHRSASMPAPALALVEETELPALQRSLAARAAAAGLGWPTADYRLLPASDSMPPVYEVHCTLKGSYPAIRHFIVDTLAGPPSAALREFALTRASSDSVDAEAHLTFAFFLRPDATPAIMVPAAASEGGQ